MAHQHNAEHSDAQHSNAERGNAPHSATERGSADQSHVERGDAEHGNAERSVTEPRADVALSSSLLVDDQLCFALYAASRSVTAVYRPLLDRLGLTYPQYLVMLVLWQRGTCAIKEISAALQLDYGTLTPLLKRLEAMGYLHRQRRADDERAVMITLTDGGHSLRSEATDVPLEISRALGLSAADTATLHILLRRVVANTGDYARGTRAT